MLRYLAALAAGFFTSVLFSFLALEIFIHAAGPAHAHFARAAAHLRHTRAFDFFSVVWTLTGTILAGFIAGSIARRHAVLIGILNACMPAVVGIALGLIGFFLLLVFASGPGAHADAVSAGEFRAFAVGSAIYGLHRHLARTLLLFAVTLGLSIAGSLLGVRRHATPIPAP